MNIMVVSKSRIDFFMFQRVKSSELEEVKKSLKTLETQNDNLKKMVSKLTKKKDERKKFKILKYSNRIGKGNTDADGV